MKTREDIVREFNNAYNLPVGMTIEEGLESKELHLCMDLVAEEAGEMDELFLDYLDTGVLNKEHLLKEMADLQYVLSGLAVRFGLDLEEAFRRVHESNMSKLGPDGKPIYNAHGKVMKGPNYKEPDLSDLV